MSGSRYLCSQLVWLVASKPRADGLFAQEYDVQWVNLEEIWDSGAVLECEEEVAPGVPATISADDVSFPGRVTAVEKHEFGWRVEVAFSPPAVWTIAKWRPEHALDLNAARLGRSK